MQQKDIYLHKKLEVSTQGKHISATAKYVGTNNSKSYIKRLSRALKEGLSMLQGLLLYC